MPARTLRSPKSPTRWSIGRAEDFKVQEFLPTVRGGVPSQDPSGQHRWCLLRHELPSGVPDALPHGCDLAAKDLATDQCDLSAVDVYSTSEHAGVKDIFSEM